MSTVIGSIDQKSFKLSHPFIYINETRGHGLVYMIGLLHHGIFNQLNLHLTTDERERGSIQIIEFHNWLIIEKASQATLSGKWIAALKLFHRKQKISFY